MNWVLLALWSAAAALEVTGDIVAAPRALEENATESESTTTTTTTTLNPAFLCSAEGTACSCATLPDCAWQTYAGGSGGICFYVPNWIGGPLVDCDLCPSQAHCPDALCAQIQDPCDCVYSPHICRWDVPTDQCLARTGFTSTPCSACPTQNGCDSTPPEVNSYSPVHGRVHGSDVLTIRLEFSEQITWCHLGPAGIKFEVDGVAYDVPSSEMSISSHVFYADVTSIMLSLDHRNNRRCGLVVPSGVVCDLSLMPYSGLSSGSYYFWISDTQAPMIYRFLPENNAQGVALDVVVSIDFSEPIVLGPSHLEVGLSRLESDLQGTVALQPVSWPLEPPGVTLYGSSTLHIRLDGKLAAGEVYSLSLPPSAVADTSGNQFAGLSAEIYIFRTAFPTVIGGSSDSDSGSLVLNVILVISSIVAVTFCCVVGCRLMYAHGDVQHYPQYLERSEKRGPTASPTHVAPEGSHWAYQAPADSWAQASRAAQAGGQGKVHPTGSHDAQAKFQPGYYAKRMGGTSGRGPFGSSAPPGSSPPPGSSAATGQASNRANGKQNGPAPPGACGQPGTAGSGQQSGPSPSQAPLSAAPQDALLPEVKAVQSRMREAMDKTLEVRKKLYKELMLQYHPDKNNNANAKEVFQYINSARGWFLHDAS